VTAAGITPTIEDPRKDGQRIEGPLVSAGSSQ
jgi:hypothetical protein